MKLGTQNPHDNLEKLSTTSKVLNEKLHIETDTQPHQSPLLVEQYNESIDRLTLPQSKASVKDNIKPLKLIASCDSEDNERRGACAKISDQHDLVNYVECSKFGTEGTDNTPICLSQPAIASMRHALEQRNIFSKIPKLLSPSDSSLDIGSTSPAKSSSSDRGLPIYAVQDLISPLNSTTISSLAGRDKTRVYLDSSSSYYTSNASSLRSSIDLSIKPVPPIPQSLVSRVLYSNYTEASHPLGVSALDTFLCDQDDGDINSADSLGGGDLPDKRQQYPGCTDGEAHICKQDTSTEYSSSSSIHFLRGSANDYSPTAQNTESSRRPLLTENGRTLNLVGGNKWEMNNEKQVKRWKKAHRRSYSSGVIADDIKCWLDEQRSINLMRQLPVGEKKSRSMTFKKNFTKSMTKLRKRLSAASSLNLVTIGRVKNVGQDGRGEFSRLNSPIESFITNTSTNIEDYINIPTQDITPNSEQVMANITFSPSLPTELRIDGGSGDFYCEFQSAEAILVESTIPCVSMEAAPRACDHKDSQNLSVDQHRFSAIYDDCVIFPFLNDTDESDEEPGPKYQALSTTN